MKCNVKLCLQLHSFYYDPEKFVFSYVASFLQHMIGGGGSGLKDGSFSEALFFNPQGLAWKGDFVCVADTDNHAVRQVWEF